MRLRGELLIIKRYKIGTLLYFQPICRGNKHQRLASVATSVQCRNAARHVLGGADLPAEHKCSEVCESYRPSRYGGAAAISRL